MSESSQSQTSDPLSLPKDQAKQRARETAQQKADEAKEELGRLAFDKLEEYFPEEAASRRNDQGNRYQHIMVGVALGFLLRHVIRRRS